MQRTRLVDGRPARSNRELPAFRLGLYAAVAVVDGAIALQLPALALAEATA